MTDLQLYLAVGLPIIAVLTSLVVSLFQISGIRTDMNRGFDAVDRRFDSIERRLEMIQGDTHQMDIRITKLEN